MFNNNATEHPSPTISVIMGVYNGERFLREAVDSVRNQADDGFGFIICDDCSTDGSSDILHEYAASDKRIKLLKNDRNLGLAATLNKCLSVARGKFIARMDTDDRSLPDRFESQLKWLENNPKVGALGSAVEFIDDNGDVFGARRIDSDQYYKLADAVRQSVLVHPSVMMRRESVEAVGGYSSNKLTTRAEDYDLWCKLCENGTVVANTHRILFQYREDESNIVRRKYVYRLQEARLKWHWIRRAKRPVAELRYAIKPLIVGLIPLGIYKKMHRKNLTNS